MEVNPDPSRPAPFIGPLPDESAHHPYHGWPVLIPPTSRDAYLSGYHALNLPPLPGEPASGDWHQVPTWWSATRLDAYGLRPQAPLWTAAGEPYGTPIPLPIRDLLPLRDARPALAILHHPAAQRVNPAADPGSILQHGLAPRPRVTSYILVLPCVGKVRLIQPEEDLFVPDLAE